MLASISAMAGLYLSFDTEQPHDLKDNAEQ